MLPESDNDKDPLRPQWRGWHIIVNTNSTRRELIRPLVNVWNYVIKNAVKFLRGREGSQLLDLNEYSNIEISKKQHRIHLHSYFTCKTTGLSFLMLDKLRDFVNKNLRQVEGFVRSNIKYRLLTEFMKDRELQDYISKDPVEIDSDSDNEFEVIPLEDFQDN